MQTQLIRSCCEGTSHLEEIIEILPKDEELLQTSYIFKALSDKTRLKILFALIDYEICVGEMARILNLPQSQVSHQLKILREKNIVKFKKSKKMSFYSIKNKQVEDILKLVLKIKNIKD